MRIRITSDVVKSKPFQKAGGSDRRMERPRVIFTSQSKNYWWSLTKRLNDFGTKLFSLFTRFRSVSHSDSDLNFERALFACETEG